MALSTFEPVTRPIVGRPVAELHATWRRLLAAAQSDASPLSFADLRIAFHGSVRLRGDTTRQAAEGLGCSHQHLTLVLAGSRVASRRLRGAIADYVGVHINAIPRAP